MRDVGQAFVIAMHELRKHIVEFKTYLPIIWIAAPIGAIFFVLHEWGDRNPLASFVGGAITSLVYLFVLIGVVVAWAFGASIAYHVGKLRYERSPGLAIPPRYEMGFKHALFGCILMLVWVAFIVLIVGKIPVVSEQFMFMTRSR